MAFVEHDNRKKAKKLAEYITGTELRKYLANTVGKYVKQPVVFDGAVGSGQLEQYIDLVKIIGVDIQPESIEAFKQNYKEKAEATVSDFFTYHYEGDKVDAIIMNPPFSLKFKEMGEEAKTEIQKQFPWKKTGVVDDIFVLKSLEYTKRYGFYILFPGLGYRKTEQRFRDEIGTMLKEFHTIENAFTDTSISVIFLVIDKEKTDNTVKRYLYEAREDKILVEDEGTIVKGAQWETASRVVEEKKIDIDELNRELEEVQSEIIRMSKDIRKILVESGLSDKDYELENIIKQREEIDKFIKEIELI